MLSALVSSQIIDNRMRVSSAEGTLFRRVVIVS
jgi:hypothetical protein